MKEKRDRVFLSAYGEDGRLIKRTSMTVYDYYEKSHQLIDSVAYRKKHGIARIDVALWGTDGDLEKEGEAYYNRDGCIIRNVSRFKDGTVTDVRTKTS